MLFINSMTFLLTVGLKALRGVHFPARTPADTDKSFTGRRFQSEHKLKNSAN